MKTIVLSQSMLFPWVGMLEQVRLADVFVHYDDVQFSKGGFVNRVQIKTASGMKWMTVPLQRLQLGQRINQVRCAPLDAWRSKHLDLLRRSFDGAPFADDAMALAEAVYRTPYDNVGQLARASLMALVGYFGLDAQTEFVDVCDLNIESVGSRRVFEVVHSLGGDRYLTGHGASRYLDHCLFDSAGIDVQYMNYRCMPYPQMHGDFVPYVSGLDLVANLGKSGLDCICSHSIGWREFVCEQAS